jgi:hypothetical protein
MYQLEFDSFVQTGHGNFQGFLALGPETAGSAVATAERPAASWDDLLLRATTIALASQTQHHIVAFDLLLEEPGALRDFMQQEFHAHPEELLE